MQTEKKDNLPYYKMIDSPSCTLRFVYNSSSSFIEKKQFQYLLFKHVIRITVYSSQFSCVQTESERDRVGKKDEQKSSSFRINGERRRKHPQRDPLPENAPPPISHYKRLHRTYTTNQHQSNNFILKVTQICLVLNAL